MMNLKSYLRKRFNSEQIKALLWKDVLVRMRQPWMTAIQFIWPCLIFVALYALRMKFQGVDIPDCQFPTRVLPSRSSLLPFFQSYICTIENECIDTKNYEEVTEFNKSPVTPITNIVQTFINEDKLYHAIVDLPQSANFLGSITAVATHPSFHILEENIGKLMDFLHANGSPVSGGFDIKNLWSNDMTFSESGKVLCGKAFPRSDSIRFVTDALAQKDFNDANKDELDAMPTEYCKQLYRDVAGTNNGKITWNYVKPVIQGKILYGPVNSQTIKFMENANDTMIGMDRLKTLIKGLGQTIQQLRVEGEFQDKFMQLVQLTKTPFVQMLLQQFKVDKSILDTIFDGLLHDQQVLDIINTVGNIFDCFSVDRYIGVENEKQLEELAIELNNKKLFLAGVYFGNNGTGYGATGTDYSYQIRMDIDNTPITLENRNRLWFPGPDGNFELHMRYHRGFVQIQHMVDQGIAKVLVDQENDRLKQLWDSTTTTTTTTEEPETTESLESITTSKETEDNDTSDDTINVNVDGIVTTTQPSIAEESSSVTSDTTPEITNDTLPESDGDQREKNSTSSSVEGKNDELIFRDERPTTIKSNDSDIRRRKRSPQFSLFDLFGTDTQLKDSQFQGLKLPEVRVHTKQFPYPKYRKDNFITGLYLAQAVQLAFFFALIIQVSTCVRQKIWTRESGNSMLMKIMGLKNSSENISWTVTTLIELGIVLLLCEIILYTGGVLQTTNPVLLYFFLMVFAGCVVAFCYMISTFFSSASIGSVSAVIFFLMTYMPYIVIVSLGTTLSWFYKFLASLSISTAFCYAWNYIMRLELQNRPLTFSSAFEGSLASNDFKYGIIMIFIDLILYTIVGYLYERFTYDEFKFRKVPTKDMDIGIGGALHNCTKKYEGSDSVALDNVSIVFRRDYITCLLGRNGAGKSTTIKLLTGQIAPTNGHVFWPQNWDRITGNEFEDRIGLCSQNNILIPNLTAKEHLELYVRIKSNDRNAEREVERVMRNLQFGKHENFFSQHLSGGFKRRLNIGIAFIASPNMVILDEPCSGVDTKARRNIWELISVLRKGRAVILATHFLDEAEHLSDTILILKDGKVVAEHDPDSLKEKFSRSFEMKISIDETDCSKTIEKIKEILQNHAQNGNIIEILSDTFHVSIPYRNTETDFINYTQMMHEFEALQADKLIKNIQITSSNLEKIFNDLVVPNESKHLNGATTSISHKLSEEKIVPIIQNEKLSEFEIMKNLFKKRFMHFKRNYRLILCVLVLPTIFEIIAMGFMTLRPPGEHDVNLRFSEALYPNSTEFYSIENADDVDSIIYKDLRSHCDANKRNRYGNICQEFDSSESVFRWILNTYPNYLESRYGGSTLNGSRISVWYNNKGYHAMPVYLNQLNNAILKTAMNNSNYNIYTNNFPLKLGKKELTTSSILQQVADAGISLILLVAFSLVVAGSSIYIVNERISGEKLQQRLCDVSFKTYWGVSFLWDYTIFIIALLLAVIVFKCFDIPVYVDKDNLLGICVLLLFFGFATIPMVHLCEKLFSDASLANMYILCMNIIIALITVTAIILFDILGESERSHEVRMFLNRAFLIFPQHALADGLVEICKNYILSSVLERYYINTYRSPVTSDLLLPHYAALFCLGVVFIIINYIIESGTWRRWVVGNEKKIEHDLETISTQQSNGFIGNGNKKTDLYNQIDYPQTNAMTVNRLSKIYKGNHHALNNISFNVKSGECFGLLGANGAGKSTVFGILSGQLASTSGAVNIMNRADGISYCPQTNALDSLLTVEEIIHFYARLRRVQNIDEITEQTLETYHLKPYRHVLVKNLSGGNRRKLSVAVTCFGSTSNVLMDEPTSDMDPVTRSIVYKAIGRLLYEKRSVILTSHTITEIDQVCGRIGVMRQGKMIVVASPKQLKMMYGNYYTVTIYYDHIEALTIERDVKKAIPHIDDLIVHSNCLQFRIQIKNFNDTNNNNSEKDVMISNGAAFSELFKKLHELTVGRGIFYTITECLLDQAFDRALEADENRGYYNITYQQSETPT